MWLMYGQNEGLLWRTSASVSSRHGVCADHQEVDAAAAAVSCSYTRQWQPRMHDVLYCRPPGQFPLPLFLFLFYFYWLSVKIQYYLSSTALKVLIIQAETVLPLLSYCEHGTAFMQRFIALRLFQTCVEDFFDTSFSLIDTCFEFDCVHYVLEVNYNALNRSLVVVLSA